MRIKPPQRIVASIIAAGLVVFAEGANAANYCLGNVTEFLVYADGKLMIHSNWRNDWTVICSTRGDWNGVSTEVCMSWYGIVASAKIHNKQLLLHYGVEVNCAALPTYGASPTPVYVRML